VQSLNLTLTDSALNHSANLLARAQARDADAFCDLCRPYEGRLFRQAVALCRDQTLAEDLVQETLIEAWKSLRRFNGRCRLFTWFCSIMLHRYQKLIRRKRPVVSSEVTVEAATDEGPSPALSSESADRVRLLHKHLDTLPHKQRQVVYLRFYVDNSLEEIAVALRCSVGTVKSRLFNGLENLRKMRALKDLNLEL
jgi:RNA polymerase sigma-70 factor, ECF subfamily